MSKVTEYADIGKDVIEIFSEFDLSVIEMVGILETIKMSLMGIEPSDKNTSH